MGPRLTLIVGLIAWVGGVILLPAPLAARIMLLAPLVIVPRVLAGEVLICLGYSEPDAGSDVASVTTRAVRATSSDGRDEWVIDGQKMFTTLAHVSKYVFLLTRTNPAAASHRGLTTFLVPMDTPGIEVRPVHTLGGERTNITFYTGVRSSRPHGRSSGFRSSASSPACQSRLSDSSFRPPS